MLESLILAGGRSKRVGKDKALTKLGDKPLLLHVVERVMAMTSEIKVIIGKNSMIDDYATILPSSIGILKDTIYRRGPLSGILTGLENASSEYALVLPCDSPFVKRGVLAHLVYRAHGIDAAVPQWPNGNIEPLHAVYQVSSSLAAAKAAMTKNEFQLGKMIRRLNKVSYVSTDYLRKFDSKLMTFFNINSKEDLTTAEELIRNATEL